MTIKKRIEKLEKQSAPKNAPRVVTVYADEVTPAKLEALRNDKSIETLIVVEYIDEQPFSTITTSRYSRRVGIDVSKL